MSRYQFQHGRTLDAVELRGFVLKKARDVRAGNTIGFLQSRFDYTVDTVERMTNGNVIFRSGNDTRSERFDADEFVYVR